MNEIQPIDYCVETINLKKTIETGFIVLGERLTKIKDGRMWENQWSSFSEYLSEMNINDSTASKLISVYRTYIGKFQIDETLLSELGWDKLYSARDFVLTAKTKTEALELVEKIKSLRRQDADELIREHKNGVCDHDWFEVHIRQCRSCNKRESIL